jgi:hypothetical protein
VLNLIKAEEKHPRESLLGKEFVECIDFLNKILPKDPSHQIIYEPFDFRKAHKKKSEEMTHMDQVIYRSLKRCGIFHYHSGKDEAQWYPNPNPIPNPNPGKCKAVFSVQTASTLWTERTQLSFASEEWRQDFNSKDWVSVIRVTCLLPTPSLSCWSIYMREWVIKSLCNMQALNWSIRFRLIEVEI